MRIIGQCFKEWRILSTRSYHPTCTIKSSNLIERKSKLICIIDCWKIHKSKTFFDWVKQKHPNVVFAVVNCTRMNWSCKCYHTMTFETCFQGQFQHVNYKCHKTTNLRLKIYTHSFSKMNNIKLQICGWFHSTWTRVQGITRRKTCHLQL
jgi:hypothetical protein